MNKTQIPAFEIPTGATIAWDRHTFKVESLQIVGDYAIVNGPDYGVHLHWTDTVEII